MNTLSSYRIASKGIVYILIVGQLWSNGAAYCDWMVNPDSEFIEHYCADESESEKEETQKDKEDKLSAQSSRSRFIHSQKGLRAFCSEKLLSLHHPDVSTPPPESSENIS